MFRVTSGCVERHVVRKCWRSGSISGSVRQGYWDWVVVWFCMSVLDTIIPDISKRHRSILIANIHNTTSVHCQQCSHFYLCYRHFPQHRLKLWLCTPGEQAWEYGWQGSKFPHTNIPL